VHANYADLRCSTDQQSIAHMANHNDTVVTIRGDEDQGVLTQGCRQSKRNVPDGKNIERVI